MCYSTESRIRKYVEGYGFLFAKNAEKRCSDKYDKKVMDTTTKTRMNVVKTAFKSVVQKQQKQQVI